MRNMLANSPNIAQNGGVTVRRAGVGAPYGRVRIRLTGCFDSVLLRGTPGTAFPTGRVRIRLGLCVVFGGCCGPSGRRPLHEPLLSIHPVRFTVPIDA